jgi:hypothetical protein
LLSKRLLKHADPNRVRIINTLHIEEILVSECIPNEAKQHLALAVLNQPVDRVFNVQGNLTDIVHWK